MEKTRNELFFEFSADEVVELLLAKEFRPCSALAMIGFLEQMHYPINQQPRGILVVCGHTRKASVSPQMIIPSIILRH